MNPTIDITLKFGSSMIISGPSGSGKTQFVIKLIENISIFNEKPERVFWCYGATKPPRFINNYNIFDIEGLPNEKDIQPLDLVIIDDLMNEGSTSNLFTKIAHHRNCFIIYITQNLYSKNSRTSNLNSHYLVLFKNPRDKTQINYLSRQMFPGKSDFLTQVFNNVTEKPFNPLFIDLKQETPDYLRVRSSPFSKPIRVYIPK